MTRTGISLTVCALIVSCRTLYGAAVPFASGDVFVGGSFGANLGKILQFSPTGVLKNTLDPVGGSEQTGMAFDSAGNLYATGFGAGNISKWSKADGSVIADPFVANDPGSDNESLVFDASGNFYVGQADGTKDVIKRDSTGGFLARYDVATGPRGSDWVDLAADQKTIVYASEGQTIRKFDVSTSTQLADFAVIPGPGEGFGLRLLSDGGLLVADGDNVKRLNSAGAVIGTYDAPGEDFFFALNLDPDGTSFWSAGYTSTKVYRFDIGSSALLTSFVTGGGISGLAVSGEITQGNPNPSVPDGGSSLLLLSLGVLGLFGYRAKATCRV